MRDLLNSKPKQAITLKELRDSLPQKKRHLVKQDLVDNINQLGSAEFQEVYKENLIRFTDVLSEFPRQGVNGYADAVMFVSYRLLGDTQFDAWKKTFPEKYKKIAARKKGIEYERSWARHYAVNKMVNRIMERSMIPVYILNADIHQEAINVQADLMRHAKSEQVRQKAAECLINTLKPPEEATLNIRVNHSSDALDELRDATRALAVAQREAIMAGRAGVRQIAESNIIDVNPDGSIQ